MTRNEDTPAASVRGEEWLLGLACFSQQCIGKLGPWLIGIDVPTKPEYKLQNCLQKLSAEFF